MAPLVGDVMIRDVCMLPPSSTVTDAARAMHDQDIGDVVVAEDGVLRGVVTDRDIVPDRRDVRITHRGHIATRPLIGVEPGTPVEEAVRLMGSGGVRRLPVVEEGRLVGIIGLGDLVVAFDPDSPLADVVVAPSTD